MSVPTPERATRDRVTSLRSLIQLRSQTRRRAASLIVLATLLFQVLAQAVPVAASNVTVTATALGATAWQGTGRTSPNSPFYLSGVGSLDPNTLPNDPGSFTVPHDGTNGIEAALQYQTTFASPAPGAVGAWSFLTSSDAASSLTLHWQYTGFHGYCGASLKLDAVVIRSGSTVSDDPLALATDSTCNYSFPSGGFSLSGDTTLALQSGDTYGFIVEGTNYNNSNLSGTLTITSGAATDFAFGPATPSPLPVDPGSTGQISVPTSASGSGTIALTASIAPAGQGVAVALGSPTVATGSSANLTVSATAGAVPGSYTATITGTLGSSTHSTTIPVTVLPATGIPGLLQAVPGSTSTGAITSDPSTADALWLSGMLNGTSGASYSLTLRTASSCPGGVLPAGATQVQSQDPLAGSIGTSGTGYFGGLIHITAGSLSNFIAAQANGGPVGPCIVVSPPNDQWVTALDISGKTGTGAATNGYIDQPGVARWYKFTVSPGTNLHIALSNLPADYDVFLFKDISQAYTDLTASNVTASGGASSLLNLNKLSAEFASADVANAFTSNAFTSNAFTSNAFTSNAFTSNAFTSNAFTSNAFTSNAFTSNAFTSNAFTSNAFTSNAFTSNAFTSNAFTSNAFTSNAFTSNAFTSNAFTSSSTFNPYGVDLSAYSSAQVRSVIAGSANVGLAPESIDGNTWTNSGTYYIRVNGKGSASSLDGAFSLSVTETGNLCNPVVAAQQSNAVLGPDGFTAPTGQNDTTLVLWDSSRIPGSAANVATLSSTLQTFASQSQIRGAVVDLSTFSGSARINALNALADANTGCVYAKNLVASAIKDVVTAYRTANPGLKYIVLVGGDNVIPFFRYPDQNGLGPESNYIPPVDPLTASEASLQSDYVLGQDDYGASIDLSLGNYSFPVPDLAVGRLVETASEATGILNAYLNHTTAGVVAPNDGNGSATNYSSLVTGYDFLADDATTVKGHLAAGTGVTPDSLIAPPKSTTPWTGADLKAALTNQRHDLVFLAGHFSSSLALAADFTTYMQTTDLVNSSVDLTNTIVFSAGCHSGYNLVDGDQVPGVTQPLDWAQAFAQKGATLIGGTGYQYGDSDFELWSERIYAEFSHQLDSGSGPVAIGDALMRSKQIYLSSTPDVLPMDAKALLESTLYGLPMLSVDMPGRENDSTTPPAIGGTPTAVSSGPGDGPRPHGHLRRHRPDTDDARVQVARQRRCQRQLDRHAHDRDLAHRRQRRRRQPGPAGPPAPDGRRDRRRQGPPRRRVQGRRLYRPDRGHPTHGRARHRALHRAPGICLPGVLARAAVPDQLLRRAHSRRPDLPPADAGTVQVLAIRRRHGHPPHVPKPGVAVVLQQQHQRRGPGLGTVHRERVRGPQRISTITFQATVTENPAGIQGVWVTWTGAGTGGSDTWQSIDLTQDPSSKALWTGTMPAPANTANFQFMAQAVNGVGLVGLDDNFGAYYGLTSAAVATAAPAPTHLALATSNPTSGTYTSTVTVSAALTSGTEPSWEQADHLYHRCCHGGRHHRRPERRGNGHAPALVPRGSHHPVGQLPRGW